MDMFFPFFSCATYRPLRIPYFIVLPTPLMSSFSAFCFRASCKIPVITTHMEVELIEILFLSFHCMVRISIVPIYVSLID
ncbi:hypothetical protein L210DRAFT_2028035 [Boletus edulis BED1]|uniref:Uncharacterized protein n=1 Tax=Boletus edulis BED1 TaxID=1328754 RepID=A0AAD4C8T4_BOLED|nr:hypothetical protein L210DRAFT_2028035 [Boletus edulis BED1]